MVTDGMLGLTDVFFVGEKVHNDLLIYPSM